MAQNKAKLRRAGGALALLGGAAACTAACAVAGTAVAAPALGADPSAPAAAPACTAKRPAIAFNRWSEDWSVLADPCLARAPLDGLKYLPLVADGSSWLSLGAGLRERYEHIDAPLFGAASAPADGYAIQRANLHADLRLGQYLQVFGQLIDARAFQKQALAPVDADRLDVEQLFVAVAVPTREGAVKLRVGRQEMGFDLQRFIAVRDGPNVRQAFDGVWADWEHGPWRLIGFATHPVQNRDAGHFDDSSSGHVTLDGLRLERQGVGAGDVSGYLLRYRRDDARFLDATGAERRNIADLRYNGKRARVDYDVEGMLQHGHVGAQQVSSWALGSIVGVSYPQTTWTPRLGLQFDMASGDRHGGDGRLGTFNPLFANGYYFALAGLTGYSNLAYAQLRTDWMVAPNLTASLEALHFAVGDSLRTAGGRDANYLGIELKFGW